MLAIIAVLISLLLPALSRSRAAAIRIACASSLREIGNAMLMYTQEHDGHFPETTHGSTADRSWIFLLARHLGQVDRVRISPADPRGDERLAANASSYILNEYIAVPLVGPTGEVIEDFTRVSRIRRPAETITVFTISDARPASVFNDHTHSRNWTRLPLARAWDRVLADIQPDRFGGSSRAPRQRGSANYLHADGHVNARPAAEIRDAVLRGQDIARPPVR